MAHQSSAGAALADLLVALVLLALLALGTAPLAVRTAGILGQGRALAGGVALAEDRRTSMENAQPPCGSVQSGRDSAPHSVFRWWLAPRDSLLLLTGLIADPGLRWRPESLAILLRCAP